jgi:hypothetical protein
LHSDAAAAAAAAAASADTTANRGRIGDTSTYISFDFHDILSLFFKGSERANYSAHSV